MNKLSYVGGVFAWNVTNANRYRSNLDYYKNWLFYLNVWSKLVPSNHTGKCDNADITHHSTNINI